MSYVPHTDQDRAEMLAAIGVEDVEDLMLVAFIWLYLQADSFNLLEFMNLPIDFMAQKLIFLAFLIAFFNQMSGINFVIYFAPRIFGLAGLDASAALLSTTGIGITNLLFTMLGVLLIDRRGRRFLMFAGSLGYIVSLSAVAWSFYTDAGGLIVVLFLFLRRLRATLCVALSIPVSALLAVTWEYFTGGTFNVRVNVAARFVGNIQDTAAAIAPVSVAATAMTSDRMSSGVPKGRVFCVSMPPPQKTNLSPYSPLRRSGSMLAAEI